MSHWCLPLNSVAKPSQPGADLSTGARGWGRDPRPCRESGVSNLKRRKDEKTQRRARKGSGVIAI